jgi:prolyl-tRNA editing enzyme YbaK/EbsC (Cys-tRNA(Pro) deacylase)
MSLGYMLDMACYPAVELPGDKTVVAEVNSEEGRMVAVVVRATAELDQCRKVARVVGVHEY